VGRQVYANLARSVEALQRARLRWAEGEPLQPVAVDRELDGTRITGTLGDLWPAAQLSVRFAGLGKPWELDVWVRHVILCWLASSAPGGLPRSSVAIGWSGEGAEAARFDEVEQPEQVLGDLLRLYWLGQQVPLPFFPRASRKYQQAAGELAPGAIDEAALRSARSAFTSDFSYPGEAHDEYVQQVFGGDDPLDPGYRPCEQVPAGYVDFPTAARVIFAPLLGLRKDAGR
jgi:exonuclease V gamma subunit